jgi:hypothetical protein
MDIWRNEQIWEILVCFFARVAWDNESVANIISKLESQDQKPDYSHPPLDKGYSMFYDASASEMGRM